MTTTVATPTPTTTDELETALEGFRAKAMASWPVRRLLSKWDRTIEFRIEGKNGRSRYLCSKEGAIQPVLREYAGKAEISLAAQEDVMLGVFKGTIHPARAHLDGRLKAEGSAKDQLVLDAIVLLIWGL